MHRAALLLTMLATLLVARPAAAFELQNGAWQSYSGVSPRGVPVCGMMATMGDASESRIIKVEIFRGHNKVNVDISKADWNIPRGLRVPVTLYFAGTPHMPLVAYGDAQTLDIVIPRAATEAFLGQLAGQPALNVYFPTGSEPVWDVPTIGARDAVRDLAHCATANTRIPTQPFAQALPLPPLASLQ